MAKCFCTRRLVTCLLLLACSGSGDCNVGRYTRDLVGDGEELKSQNDLLRATPSNQDIQTDQSTWNQHEGIHPSSDSTLTQEDESIWLLPGLSLPVLTPPPNSDSSTRSGVYDSYIPPHGMTVGEAMDLEETRRFLSRIDNSAVRNMTEEYLGLCPYASLCSFSLTPHLGELEDLTSCCQDCVCGQNCPHQVRALSIPSASNEICGPIAVFYDEKYAKSFTTVTMKIGCNKEKEALLSYLCQEPFENREEDLHLLDVVPVTDKRTYTVYRNYYCAKCAGLRKEDISPWHPELKCKNNLSSSMNLTEIRLNGDCFIENTADYIYEEHLTKCYPMLVDHCNKTGLWNQYDSFTERACLSFESIYDTRSTTGSNYYYKNVFCAICNGVTIEKFCSTTGSHPPVKPRFSFSALLDFNLPDDDPLTESSMFDPEFSPVDGFTSNDTDCGERYVIDKRKGICIKMSCSRLSQYKDGHCEAIEGNGETIYETILKAVPSIEMNITTALNIGRSLQNVLDAGQCVTDVFLKANIPYNENVTQSELENATLSHFIFKVRFYGNTMRSRQIVATFIDTLTNGISIMFYLGGHIYTLDMSFLWSDTYFFPFTPTTLINEGRFGQFHGPFLPLLPLPPPLPLAMTNSKGKRSVPRRIRRETDLPAHLNFPKSAVKPMPPSSLFNGLPPGDTNENTPLDSKNTDIDSSLADERSSSDQTIPNGGWSISDFLPFFPDTSTSDNIGVTPRQSTTPFTLFPPYPINNERFVSHIDATRDPHDDLTLLKADIVYYMSECAGSFDPVRLSQLMDCAVLELERNEYHYQEIGTGIYIPEMKWYLRFQDYYADSPFSVFVCKDTYLSQVKTMEQKTDIRSNADHFAEFVTGLVCTSVSVLCLMLSLVVFWMFPELRTVPGKNNMMLMLTLALAQIFFLVTSTGNIQIDWLCKTVGITVHYLWLSAIFWMGVCCFHMFRVFVRIGKPHRGERKTTFPLYVVLVNVLSLMFVVATVVSSLVMSDGTSMGYGVKVCYIASARSVLFAFAVPVGVVVIGNLVMFVLVVVKIRSMPSIQKNVQNDRNNTLIFAKLSTLTGITWIFGFVYQWTLLPVFSYLFVIFNASQGVFLMISFVCNHRVLNLLRNRIALARTSFRSKSGPPSTDTIRA